MGVIYVKSEEMEKLLRSSREEERVEALRHIRENRLPVTREQLTRALGDPSWRVRKEATECFLARREHRGVAEEAVALLHSEDNAGLRNAAMDILIRMGSLAVPALKAELGTADHDVRKFLVDILGDIGDESCTGILVRILSDPDINVRTAAAENLGKLRSRVAIPALLDAMDVDDFAWRFTVLESLAQIGERIAAAGLIRLKDDRLLRKALFDCLGCVGDLDAIPVLVEGLRDDMRKCREAAALALVRLAQTFPREIGHALAQTKFAGTAQTVSKLLEHRDRALQEAGIRILGWIGDGSVAPCLLPLLGSEIDGPLVLEALQNFGDQALCDLVRDNLGNNPEQDVYLVYLAGIGHCHEVGDRIVSALRSGDDQMRTVAARSLETIGTAAAIAPLIAALADPCEDVVQAASQALSGIGRREGDQVLAQVAPLAESSSPEVRSRAVQILGALGDTRCQHYLALAVKDESPRVRQAAVRALDVLPPDEKESLLVLALTDEDSEVRALAAETLGGVGRESVVGPLGLALGDDDLWVRTNTVRSLGRIGGRRALALVERALGDPVGLVAIAALETLVELDPEHAADFLRRALDHGDQEVVKTALQSLGKTAEGPWVKDVVCRMLAHPQWDVRLALVTMVENFSDGAYRGALEKHLVVEGDDLVREKINDVLARPAVKEG